jgi:hypothetical protein
MRNHLAGSRILKVSLFRTNCRQLWDFFLFGRHLPVIDEQRTWTSNDASKLYLHPVEFSVKSLGNPGITGAVSAPDSGLHWN